MTSAMVQPGMSRIPRAAGVPAKDPLMGQRRTASAPSKLEQLQAEYQQKLLREKEQKIIEMYERNTQLALQKTNSYSRPRNGPTPPSKLPLPPSGPPSANRKVGLVRGGGSVRDFFNQRRNNENGWVNNNNNEYWRTQNMRSPGAPRRPIAVPPRGKTQPLAPIQQPNTQPKIEQRRYRPPVPPNARRPGFVPDDTDSAPSSANSRISPSKEPLPAIPASQQNGKQSNFQKWKSNQAKNAKNKDQDFEVEIKEAPNRTDKQISEFQKWQQEQDQQRQERIKKYQEKQQQQQQQQSNPGSNPGSARYTPEQKRKYLQLKNRQGSFTQYSDEDEEEQAQQPQSTRRGSSRQEQEIADKKKQELEAMIAKEKAELIQLQKKKRKEDAQEQRLREQEQKRQAEQEERLRKMKHEQEEEQRRQEEQAEREERERQRKEQMKKRQQAAKQKQRSKPPPPPPPEDEDDGPAPPKIDNTAFYEKLAAEAEDNFGQVKLAECSICGRKFAADRLDKHIKICAKSTSKKRKVFDPVKMRTEGTEAAQYTLNPKHKPQAPPQPKKNNWRKKHEDFVKMMQYNKKLAAIEASGGNAADLPPPPPSENPDYVQCPTCSRKFNPTAAERHIPRCKDIKSRAPPPKRKR